MAPDQHPQIPFHWKRTPARLGRKQESHQVFPNLRIYARSVPRDLSQDFSVFPDRFLVGFYPFPRSDLRPADARIALTYMSEEAERNKRNGQRSWAQSKTALAQPSSYVKSTFVHTGTLRRKPPQNYGYCPPIQQQQQLPTRQPNPNFQKARTATCTTPPLPTSTGSPLPHEHRLVYDLRKQHSRRPPYPQAPAPKNGQTTKCKKHNHITMHDAPPTHQHQQLGTGTLPTTRQAPKATCRAHTQPTITGQLVQ